MFDITYTQADVDAIVAVKVKEAILVERKSYDPNVTYNDDGTFSLELPNGDELRIVPPSQYLEAVVSKIANTYDTEHIATLIEAAVLVEREACAKECDMWAAVEPFSDFSSGSAKGAENCAAAIRARGNL